MQQYSCNKNEVTVVIDAEIVFEDILLSAIWEVASSHFHCEYPVAPSDFKVSIEDKDSIKTPFFIEDASYDCLILFCNFSFA